MTCTLCVCQVVFLARISALPFCSVSSSLPCFALVLQSLSMHHYPHTIQCECFVLAMPLSAHFAHDLRENRFSFAVMFHFRCHLAVNQVFNAGCVLSEDLCVVKCLRLKGEKRCGYEGICVQHLLQTMAAL